MEEGEGQKTCRKLCDSQALSQNSGLWGKNPYSSFIPHTLIVGSLWVHFHLALVFQHPVNEIIKHWLFLSHFFTKLYFMVYNIISFHFSITFSPEVGKLFLQRPRWQLFLVRSMISVKVQKHIDTMCQETNVLRQNCRHWNLNLVWFYVSQNTLLLNSFIENLKSHLISQNTQTNLLVYCFLAIKPSFEDSCYMS